MQRSAILVFIFAAAIAAGCNRDTPYANNNHAPGTASDAARTGGAVTELTAEHREFVQATAENGRHEVEVTKLAQNKGQSGEMKDFANKLQRDHEDVNARLEQIIAKLNLPAAGDAAPAADKREAMDKLALLSGSEFDRAFINMMVEAHQKSITKFEQ